MGIEIEHELMPDGSVAHIADTAAAHAASAVSVDSTTLVGVGTDVQAVLEELDNAIVAATLTSYLGPVQAASSVTIATGVLTLTADQYHYRINTEASASTDDLDTITGLVADRLYIFRLVTSARNVVFKHGTGNILCPGSSDVTLDLTQDWCIGLADQTGTNIYILFPRNGSLADYGFTPDSFTAPVTGDEQGIVWNSGPNTEICVRIDLLARTAPSGGVLTVQIEYADTGDLDTAAVWTEIGTLSVADGTMQNATTTFTTATIPADRLIRCNWDAVNGAAKCRAVLRVRRALAT